MSDVTYVALLRGVNIGGSKRVAMADLRALVSTLGYRDVRTLLNSGNVVFTGSRTSPSRVGEAMSAALASRLGVTARVVVLTGAELAAAAAANPLLRVATNPSRLVCAVPVDAGDLDRLKPLLRRDWTPEALAAGPRAAYFWCPDGFHDSPVAEAVRRALGDSVTMRNWATVSKLVALSAAKRP